MEVNPHPMHGLSRDMSAETNIVFICHTNFTMMKQRLGRRSQISGLRRGLSIMLAIVDQISCLQPCKCSGGVTDAIPGYYWFHHRALSIKEKRACDSIFLWKGRCSPSWALSIPPPTPVSLLSLYSVFHFRHINIVPSFLS